MPTFKDFLNDLYRTCIEKRTGTYFITSIENRACHIIVDKGVITALSYGAHRGEQVVKVLADIDIARFAFKNGTKMPLSGRSFVDEGYDALKALNIDTQIPVEQTPETVSKKPKRIYRGREIKDDKPEEQNLNNETPKKKKPQRIYRGHVLDD